MADRPRSTRTVHHVLDGAVEMYHVDAVHALTHRSEWKDRPWKDAEVEAFKRRKAKEAKGAPADEVEPVADAADESGEE